MTLTELGILHQTDKATAHGYTDIYEQYLAPMRYTAKKVLEVGIAAGASLKMWADYFENATIFGVDHNETCVIDCPKHPFIQPILGEASDPTFWLRFAELWGINFDCACDDGAHHASAIIDTFNSVWPLIKPQGFYLIEDLHTSFDPAYNRTKGYPTSVDWLKREVDHIMEYGHDNCGRPTSASPYEFIAFHKSLCIIKKR